MPQFTGVILGFDPGGRACGKGAFGWSACSVVDRELQPASRTGVAKDALEALREASVGNSAGRHWAVLLSATGQIPLAIDTGCGLAWSQASEGAGRRDRYLPLWEDEPMTDANTVAEAEPAAGIRVSRVVVRGFRCVHEVRLDLAPGTTYLVGENNSGKTSILLALWSALGSRRPVDDDLRREGDGGLADEASVDLLIVPAAGQRFSPQTAQQLVLVQRDPSTGSETVGIRTVFLPSREGRVLATRRSFLQPDDGGDWRPVVAPALPPTLMTGVEAHLLDASRDLVSELGNRTSVWGRVLSDLQIEQDPDEGEGARRPRAGHGRHGHTDPRCEPRSEQPTVRPGPTRRCPSQRRQGRAAAAAAPS